MWLPPISSVEDLQPTPNIGTKALLLLKCMVRFIGVQLKCGLMDEIFSDVVHVVWKSQLLVEAIQSLSHIFQID